MFVGALSACASAGRVTFDETSYRLNRSDLVREGDHYRLWVWSYRGQLLRYFGKSPIGLQILLPADARAGDRFEPGKDCELWIRHDWNLVDAATNSLWQPVPGGRIFVDAWSPEEFEVQGRLAAPTESGLLQGHFRTSRRSMSDNVIR